MKYQRWSSSFLEVQWPSFPALPPRWSRSCAGLSSTWKFATLPFLRLHWHEKSRHFHETSQSCSLSVGYISFSHHLCSVGYSDELAGLACTIVILVGAAGTVLFGVLAQVWFGLLELLNLCIFFLQKTGKIVEITKLCCLGAIVCVLILSYLLLLPDVGIYILIAGAFLGLFALGVFPLALELTVEATFPCDQVGVKVTMRLAMMRRLVLPGHS